MDSGQPLALPWSGTEACTIYLQLFDGFRNKLNTPLQRVIFVAASDDPKWLRENLEDMDDLYLAEDLFEEKDRGGEYDLALLSLCNHSIIGVNRHSKKKGFM